MDLAKWMAREGLDDEQVAAGVHSHRVTINRIRRNKNKPSWELAARIKAFTNGRVRADDFLPSARKTV